MINITSYFHSSKWRVKNLIFLIIPFALLAQNYQFGPNVRVNDDPGGQAYHNVYSSGGRAIAARGDTVYLAYRGDQTGLSCIYFTKSTNCGQTWTPGLRVSFPSQGIIHGLTVDKAGNIFIVYTHDDPITQDDIHFTKSTDGGLSFNSPIKVNDDTTTYTQWHPAIAVDTSGQNVFVTWEDNRNDGSSNWDIYFARSTDGGATFEPNIRVDDTGSDPSWQRDPSIAVDRSGTNVYITWFDGRTPLTDEDIYFSHSTDGGISFSPNVLVSDTATTGNADQRNPSIAIDTLGRIFIAWKDSRQPSRGCYFSRSDDGGITFGPNVRVIDRPEDNPVDFPSIAVDNSEGVYIAWGDDFRLLGSGYRIFFAFSNTAGDSFMANVRVDDLPPVPEYWLWTPTLTINEDRKVFISWQDDRLNHMNAFDIYFALGTYVGIQEFYNTQPSMITLQCHPNPFRKMIDIRWQISDDRLLETNCKLQLRIYDISGRLIKQFNNVTNLSLNQITWAGDDHGGHSVPCGTYFVELGNGNVKRIVKVIKIK